MLRSDQGCNQDKLNRYYCHIMMNTDDRGFIKLIMRNKASYDCMNMKDKKTEAKGMDKIEHCSGCRNSLSRDGMMKCSGCNLSMFCIKGCYNI